MMENLILTGVTLLIGMVAGGWLKSKFSPIASKVAKGSEVAETVFDTAGDVADKLGMNDAGVLFHKAADVTNEVGNLAEYLAVSTADGTFDAKEAQQALILGKNIYVEGKNFMVSIKPLKK